MTKNPVDTALEKQLDYLKLPYCKENFRPLAAEGNAKHWSHIDYLQRLIDGEAAHVKTAPSFAASRQPVFPVIKTLIPSAGTGQKRSINSRSRICSACASSTRKPMSSSSVLCGLGKTHLAAALGYAACQPGYSVLFANAIDVVNTLSAAQAQGSLKSQLKRYRSPALLVLDKC